MGVLLSKLRIFTPKGLVLLTSLLILGAAMILCFGSETYFFWAYLLLGFWVRVCILYITLHSLGQSKYL